MQDRAAEPVSENLSAPGKEAAHGNYAAVVLDNVQKSYGSKIAVRDLSLALHAGEVFAFLGPNGAGKTTTLKMTTGLLRADKGCVQVCGHDMARDAQAAKTMIAYVPDEPYLYEKLTGREFIHFVRDMYGVPVAAAAQRLDKLIEQFDMAPFLDRLCESYSHGMKQKVILASAMIHSPRLMVVDEPMVGLDPRTIHVTKTLFRRIADGGGTVFMSTHTLDVAETIADRIGIINGGRLVALGTLSELRQQLQSDSRLEEIFLRLTEEEQEPHEPAGS
jgi:ABC-2 type transport system ATP-binding protein